jgi:hypothetical protein
MQDATAAAAFHCQSAVVDEFLQPTTTETLPSVNISQLKLIHKEFGLLADASANSLGAASFS